MHILRLKKFPHNKIGIGRLKDFLINIGAGVAAEYILRMMYDNHDKKIYNKTNIF